MKAGTIACVLVTVSMFAMSCSKNSWKGAIVDCHTYEISDAVFGGAGKGTMRGTYQCEKDGVNAMQFIVDGRKIEQKVKCAKRCLVSVQTRLAEK